MSLVCLFASGKGGVGKSTAAACVGEALARLGSRVCLVDADIGLRDQDAILGLENLVVYDLLDVTAGGCPLEQALLPLNGAEGLMLLPASQFARSKELESKAFQKVVRRLRRSFDFVLIDCPAGIERGLRNALAVGPDCVVLLCTPDDVCIRDAERVIQLCAQREVPRPRLLVNRLRPELIEAGEMYTAATVAQTLECELLGEVPEDQDLYRALLRHIRPMDVASEATGAFTRVARRLRDENVPLPAYGTQKKKWWQRLKQRRLKEVKILDR